MDKMKCSTHRDKDAIATCVNCGKPYCAVCLERIGRGYVCFSCLKKVARETLKKGAYKPLTIAIIVAAAIFFAMAIAAIALNMQVIIGAVAALAASKPDNMLPAFIDKNPVAVRSAALGIVKAVVFGIEAYLLAMNKAFSFWLGLLASAIIVYFAMVAYTALPKEALVFELMLPFVAFVLILVSKKDLIG